MRLLTCGALYPTQKRTKQKKQARTIRWPTHGYCRNVLPLNRSTRPLHPSTEHEDGHECACSVRCVYIHIQEIANRRYGMSRPQLYRYVPSPLLLWAPPPRPPTMQTHDTTSDRYTYSKNIRAYIRDITGYKNSTWRHAAV